MITLNARWRVAYDPLQWILQRREGDRWRDVSFCVTREALIRCIRDKVETAVDLSGVLALPDWHPDRGVRSSGTPTPTRSLTELLGASVASDATEEEAV